MYPAGAFSLTGRPRARTLPSVLARGERACRRNLKRLGGGGGSLATVNPPVYAPDIIGRSLCRKHIQTFRVAVQGKVEYEAKLSGKGAIYFSPS